jgi:hypothetical protein
VSVYPGRVARHVIITWYASCVVGESYPIHACVRAEDILHESAECANRIRPSALHVINSTNRTVTYKRGDIRFIALPLIRPLIYISLIDLIE